MNILLLAPHPFFQNRGTPIAVRLLAQVLTGEGHAVDLLTYHEGEDVELPGLKIHRIPALLVHDVRPGFSFKKLICDAALFFKSLALVRRGDYDVVHAVEESAFIALFIKKLFGIPFLYDMDSSLPQQMMERYPMLRHVRGVLERFERAAIRSSLGVVAVCKSIEDAVRDCEPEKPVLRLEDISLLEGQESEATGETDLNIPGPLMMYVGNLEPYQGIDLLLESLVVVKDSGQPGNLVIVGGKQGDIDDYRKKVRALGLTDRVFLVGQRPVNQLGAYLSQADVLVSPRIQGHNTPMKIYSYLDSGKPLLATRLFTHTQVLDDEIAYLASPEPQAMGEGLIRLLRDRELSARLAANARLRVKQEFTFEAYKRKLTNFYQTVESRIVADGKATATRGGQQE